MAACPTSRADTHVGFASDRESCVSNRQTRSRSDRKGHSRFGQPATRYHNASCLAVVSRLKLCRHPARGLVAQHQLVHFHGSAATDVAYDDRPAHSRRGRRAGAWHCPDAGAICLYGLRSGRRQPDRGFQPGAAERQRLDDGVRTLANSTSHTAAFSNLLTFMGCSSICNCRELTTNLDFENVVSYASGSDNTDWATGDDAMRNCRFGCSGSALRRRRLE